MIEKKIQQRILQGLGTNSQIANYLRKEMEPYRRLMAYYNCALMEVETKFRVLNEEFSLEHERNPIESIKTRMKKLESVVEKMERKNIPFSIESIEQNIHDIAGIRIICAFPEDIYFLADCLLQQDDITLIYKKDYIKEPKENGYRSLHLIVRIPIFLMNNRKEMNVEVQLRTIAMDFWATLEHRLKYKKNLPENVNIDEMIEELRQCSEESARLDARMDNIRKRIGF